MNDVDSAGISEDGFDEEGRALGDVGDQAERAPPEASPPLGPGNGSNDSEALSSTERQGCMTSSESSVLLAPDRERPTTPIAVIEGATDSVTSCDRSNSRGGKRAGAGRKPAGIDLTEFEKLAAMQCTNDEMAGFFGVSVRTIEGRAKHPA